MNALEFVKPKRPNITVENLVFPEDSQHPYLVERSKLRSMAQSTSIWRNVVAMYLRGAQVPVKDIADILSITPSRTSAIISQARKRILTKAPSWHNKPPVSRRGAEFTPEEIAAHRLWMDEIEMIAAESALSAMFDAGNDQRVFVISLALTRGRERFKSARASVNGVVCTCLTCELTKRTCSRACA